MGTAPSSTRETYRSVLDVHETQAAIKLIKDRFEANLAEALDLRRVTAPLVVPAGTGVNDDLNGVERPVAFAVAGLGGRPVEIVQSLAKWKRLALAELEIPPGTGLYTDMNAVRPDETLDALHSVYVDQWDWERVMRPADRTTSFLERIVRRIYRALKRTEHALCEHYPELHRVLPDDVTFVHAEELAARLPHLAPGQREDRVAREHGAVFVVGVGAALAGGEPHDGRAPDYDDWITPNGRGRGLNGDLVVWHEPLGCALELSSMGIRVSPESLSEQLAVRSCEARAELEFHRRLLNGELPQSVGGGIGQSRLCMFLLRKAHIGEVQVGIWPDEMREACRRAGVRLL